MTWATFIYMNMGETRAILRRTTAAEVKEAVRQLPEHLQDGNIVYAISNLNFLNMAELDSIMRQFNDLRLGIKKERKEAAVKNWLSRFNAENHDEHTGKLIHAYEDEEEEMKPNETPVTDNAERPADEVVEEGSETTSENEEGTTETNKSTETATAETGAEDELKAVVNRIAKKKRAAAADGDDDSTQPEGNKVATKKTAAKKKGPAAKKTAPAKKTTVKKTATGGAKKGFPYPAPDPESKCGQVLAFLNEQIKKKDIAENEKAEKAELFEAAAKKFDAKVITIRTYASDHRDKLKWRAARKSAQ
jgi:hypothetical protein